MVYILTGREARDKGSIALKIKEAHLYFRSNGVPSPLCVSESRASCKQRQRFSERNFGFALVLNEDEKKNQYNEESAT